MHFRLLDILEQDMEMYVTTSLGRYVTVNMTLKLKIQGWVHYVLSSQVLRNICLMSTY